MFDKCKFSLLTAFQIVFKICTNKKEISAVELSKELGLRQNTCRDFKRKVHEAMRDNFGYSLKGEVHVCNFYIDDKEADEKSDNGKKGKRLIIVALEIVKGGYGRAYASVARDAASDSFKSFIEKFIDADAVIVIDDWKGYAPLKHKYEKLRQVPSNKDNFPELYIHFENIKSWLRGKDYHISEKHLQGYLNEYHFKFNRRKKKGTIFDAVIRGMVLSNQHQRSFRQGRKVYADR